MKQRKKQSVPSRPSKSSLRKRIKRNDPLDEDFIRAREVVDPEFARELPEEDPARLTGLKGNDAAPPELENLPIVRHPEGLGRDESDGNPELDPEGYLKKDIDAEEMFGEQLPAPDQESEGEEAEIGPRRRKLHHKRKAAPSGHRRGRKR